MWSSSRVVQVGALLLTLAIAPALSACTGFTPVYGDNGLGAQRLEVKYGTPGNRLEQIIYQDLALKLGKAAGHVPTVSVSVSQAARDLATNTVVNPVVQMQMTVTAAISVVDADGKVLFQGSRSASADYTTNAQAFASQEAASEAAERAAKALADTVRLQVIAALAK